MSHQWSYVQLLNAWGPWTGNAGGFRIAWACELGIGELTVYIDHEGVTNFDTELMDDAFCEEVLMEFYRRARQRPWNGKRRKKAEGEA